jgi:hypothetical protein
MNLTAEISITHGLTIDAAVILMLYFFHCIESRVNWDMRFGRRL